MAIFFLRKIMDTQERNKKYIAYVATKSPKTRKWPFPFDVTNFKANKKTQAVSSVWAVGSSFYAALFSGNFEVNAVIPNFLNVALISSIAHI